MALNLDIAVDSKIIVSEKKRKSLIFNLIALFSLPGFGNRNYFTRWINRNYPKIFFITDFNKYIPAL